MSNNVSQLADLLAQLAAVLQRFVSSDRAGAHVWTGEEYALAAEARDGDPAVAAWWATAFTAAHLIAGQRSLTPAQHEFLQQQLFGGMGSLNDVWLDSSRWGLKPMKQIVSWRLFAPHYTIASKRSLHVKAKKPNHAIERTADRCALHF